MIFIKIILLLLMLTLSNCHKICSKLISDSTECQQLARTEKLACRFNLHSVDCLLNIQKQASHVGRVDPEEALLGAASLLRDNVVVLGKIHSRFPPIQTVVVVRNNIENGFLNLRNKKLCHPGYDHDPAVSRFILQEFENKIIDLDIDSYCNNNNGNITLVENHVKTLSEFFSSSCRPGPWTEDLDFDKRLKNTYTNLCSQCGGPEGCNVEYKVPFNDSLRCLDNGGGDIAITTLFEAERFFNSSLRNNTYRYLGKDGNLYNPSQPQIWTRQIPSILVAEKSVAQDIKVLLAPYLTINTTTDDTVSKSLKAILNLKRGEQVDFLDDFPPLKDFVSGYRQIPTKDFSKSCNKRMRWCTYNADEQDKCLWLSQAALNEGIVPVVECVRSSKDNELSCLDDIESKRADVVVASADYGYILTKKHLEGLAYPESYPSNLSTILIAFDPKQTNIKSFNDLKGKRACFPEYGGAEFLAFINVARSLKTLSDSCDFGKLISEFLDNSCLPGARDYQREISEDADSNKLCDVCRASDDYYLTGTAVYCNADDINIYYGSSGALKCLENKASDFAVVTKQKIRSSGSNYTVLCKNNTVASYSGFEVDKNCALTIITASVIVSRNDNSLNNDFVLTLKEFERKFGENLNKPFHLFDKFNGTKDGLFLDSTPGISFDTKSEYVRNYVETLKKGTECGDGGSGAGGGGGGGSTRTIVFSTILLILPLIILL